MTIFNVPPLDNFNFKRPEEFDQWFQRFEIFSVASGLNANEDSSVDITEENAKVYKEVLKAFKNISLFEETQSLKEQNSIPELNNLVNPQRNIVLPYMCFPNTVDMLTPEKAINQVRQKESVKKQQMLLRSPQTEQIHMVKIEMNIAKERFYQNRRKTHKCAPDVGQQGYMADHNVLQFERCVVVAVNRTIGSDNKTKRVHEVLHSYRSGAEALTDGDESCYGYAVEVSYKDNDEVEDRSFLGVVTGQDDEQWTIKFKVRQERITFQIDTGADVTLIPDYVHKLIRSPPLTKSHKNYSCQGIRH
ncbi:hypothetical protein MAR_036510 [Mya arenaria]|uniref:Peptidase A2 domain-containing protein n=1 Tax=Mya arenaria TaxID=6604 RepID=A0ABY7FUG3_MYAAR|nr:hypothetical protein MAR_036510 [Mya arenaria]